MHGSATAECLSAPDEIMPASLGNVPRFPETIREREIRGICSAVSQRRSLPSESGGGVSEQKPPFTTRQPHFAHCDNATCLFAALSKLEEMEANIFPDMLPYSNSSRRKALTERIILEDIQVTFVNC